jgi:hypothetical protein
LTNVEVYVDDLITASTTLAEIKKFKEEIKMKFKMFDLGLLTFYIGLEVQQSSSGIVLCQTHYVVRILEETCMAECTSNHAIMEERLKLSRDNEVVEDATLYHKLINSLRYLAHTWLGLIFTMGYLSRFIQ